MTSRWKHTDVTVRTVNVMNQQKHIHKYVQSHFIILHQHVSVTSYVTHHIYIVPFHVPLHNTVNAQIWNTQIHTYVSLARHTGTIRIHAD